MKIAISGKGGVGKSTLAAALALLLARNGNKVLAVDADPDANLASALGVPGEQQKKIVPISEQVALIEDRTGAKVKQYGQVFKINPDVSDVADKYAYVHEGVALLVLGAIERGGSGCACPESILLRALVTDLVLHKEESLVIDFEAGVEHLGRATAQGVDVMIAVVEPGRRSIDCALRVEELCRDIGVQRVGFVGNKVTSGQDEKFIVDSLRGAGAASRLLGTIPFDEAIRQADMEGRNVLDCASKEIGARFAEILRSMEATGQ